MKQPEQERALKEPDIQELFEDWTYCVDNRDSRVYARQKNNVHRRTCWWAGQTDDGRRWGRRGKEKDVFPWPGAADTRVHLVDLYCKADAAMLATIWRRQKVVVNGTEINDARRASKMTQLLRWMKYTQMKEYPSEMRLLANYMLERGAAVQGIWWVERRQMGYETVSVLQLRELAAMARQAVAVGGPDIVAGLQNIQLASLDEILANPTRDEEAYVIADALYPETRKEAIKRAIDDLRDSGEARIPRPYLFMNRPRTCALALNEDVFLPPECGDIDETTMSIHWREQVSETTLRARQESMGWDPGWVQEMIETQRGRRLNNLPDLTPRRLNSASSGGRILEQADKLFEVVHSYRMQHTEDNVPVINCTVWSPGLRDKSSRRKKGNTYASHQELTYDHGTQPFVVYRREMRVRNIDESRGVGEVAGTWEDGIKAEIDSSRDRNSLNTIPPSYHPVGRPPEEWGPGAQIGTSQPDRYGFFRGVGWDVGSRESREVLKDLADRYFGRVLKDGSNQLESGYITQDLADTWMESCARADTMVLQLCQQYMPEQVAIRVVGEEKGRTINVSKAEIQGQFDLSVSFSVDNLNSEVVGNKIKLMTEALQIDRNAKLDVDAMLGLMFDLIDPQMGERVLRPQGEGIQEQIKDEADAYAKIFAGLPVDVEPGPGGAWQQRLEWLNTMLSQNATAQERLQKDPNFKALIERRMQQLQHQMQQFGANAQAGRTGAL